MKIKYDRYVRTHGKKPSGLARYTFTNKEKGDPDWNDKSQYISLSGKLTDILPAVKKWATSNGHNLVYLMESTRTNKIKKSELRRIIREEIKRFKESSNSIEDRLLNDPSSLTRKDLNVKGNLDLSNTSIKSLPQGLKVSHFLNLANCTNLTSLPENLEVGGDLNLANCINLTYLPKNLKVYSLSLVNCKNLISLPKGLKVEGSLSLKGTPLAKKSEKELLKMLGPGGYITDKIYR